MFEFDHKILIGIGTSEERLKFSALFFDKVIPAHKEHQVTQIFIPEIKINEGKIDALITQDRKEYTKQDVLYLASKILPSTNNEINKLSKDEMIDRLLIVINEGRTKNTNLRILEISRQLNQIGYIGIPIFNEAILLERIFEDYELENKFSKVEVQLMNAPIINVKDLTWEQIIEAKKDKEFCLKLKRFGVFINKNYSGKELNYIIDDLAIQLEDYQNSCKRHGIDLINTSIKSLADSKSLFGTLALVLGSVAMNIPEAALLSGTAGAVLEVAKMKILINEKRDSYYSFVKDSPISLITEIEDMKLHITPHKK